MTTGGEPRGATVSQASRILLIDDDRGTCKTVADVLRLKGYAVETAGLGHEGLKKLRARPFNAAIVDIKLPDISGLDLLPAIRESSPGIEVILITGYASLNSAIQAVNGEAFAYITKPFEMDHLLATLEKALGRQRLVMENRRLYQEAQRELAERKRAEEKLQARYKEVETLHEMGQTILSSQDLKAVLGKILDQALSTTHLDVGNIRLFEPSGNMVMSAYCGYQDNENIHRHHVDRSGLKVGTLVPKVIASGKSLVVKVLASEGLRTFKKEGVQSAIVVAVCTREEVLGVIEVGSRTPRRFQPDEVRIIDAIGNQIGVAVQKARLYEETQRSLQRIRALHEIELAISSSLDLGSILDILMDKIGSFLPDFASEVWLLDRERRHLERIVCGKLDKEAWMRGDLGRVPPLLKAALDERVPVIASNLQTDPRVLDASFFRNHGLVSYLGVPLIAKGEVLGVVTFMTREEHQFSAEEKEFLTTLAGQAAIAIHNSQLYEQTKKQAVELEKANRVKTEFLSVMSHELRTPLNVITGYTGMVQDGMLGEITQKQKDALGKVLAHSDDLLTMINSILCTTTFEAKAIKVESHEVSLGDFLDKLRPVYGVPSGKEFTLNWNYPSDLPVVKTDSEKLKHILQNLINNAIKFTEKGSVTISARIKPGRRQKATGQFVEFKVADTGIGIHKEALPFIFEKFRQVDSSETRPYGGVGLGLYIVKQFTEMLGGKVEVQSDPAKGSTFTVTIPYENGKGALP